MSNKPFTDPVEDIGYIFGVGFYALMGVGCVWAMASEFLKTGHVFHEPEPPPVLDENTPNYLLAANGRYYDEHPNILSCVVLQGDVIVTLQTRAPTREIAGNYRFYVRTYKAGGGGTVDCWEDTSTETSPFDREGEYIGGTPGFSRIQPEESIHTPILHVFHRVEKSTPYPYQEQYDGFSNNLDPYQNQYDGLTGQYRQSHVRRPGEWCHAVRRPTSWSAEPSEKGTARYTMHMAAPTGTVTCEAQGLL